jgi:hypothetical protein
VLPNTTCDGCLQVDGKARVDAWERSELLEKIKADTERTRDLKEQRTHIQLQRRQANMDASFERLYMQPPNVNFKACNKFDYVTIT